MSMLREWWDDFGELVVLIGVVLLVMVLLFFGVVWLDCIGCYSKARAMGVECTWGPMQGCIITTPSGVKVPIEQYRVLDGELGD